MKFILRGKIRNFVPFFKGSVNNGVLVLKENGRLNLTVDTGFSVSIGDGGNPSPSGEAKFCEMVDMISRR